MNRHPARLRLPELSTDRMLSARSAGCILAVLLLHLAAVPANPIAITITTGGAGWTVNVPPANLPTLPGRDISVSTYTSANPQTVLSIRKNPGGWMPAGTGWIVTVNKVDTTWHANLGLYIQRTSNNANLVGPRNVYQLVTNTAQEFFRCNSQTNVTGINCQLQLRGVSAVVGKTNSTTIVYTVTEF